MQIHHPTVLLADDHAQLERFMCTMTGSRSPLANLLKRKLDTAMIVPPSAAQAGLVTSGSRVRFAVDGAAEERQLTWDLPRPKDAWGLSLQQPRGLALLGLTAGQSIPYQTDSGGTEIVEVQQVWPAERKAASPAAAEEGPLRRFLKGVLTRIQRGRTIATLERLDDLVLRDIGITRGEIPDLTGIVAGVIPAPDPQRPLAEQTPALPRLDEARQELREAA